MRKLTLDTQKIVLGVFILLGFSAITQARPAERWLHVRVIDNSGQGETVNVNMPLSMAEKVLPAINQGDLHNGKITTNLHMEDVDLATILDALRTAPDNEFVTVQSKDENVRVAKVNDNLVVHVVESGKDGEHVDVTIPMRVINALVAKGTHEMDLTAAIHEMEQMGDATLVTVQEATESVRIWIDSSNSGK
jgi:hypothetical protein